MGFGQGFLQKSFFARSGFSEIDDGGAWRKKWGAFNSENFLDKIFFQTKFAPWHASGSQICAPSPASLLTAPTRRGRSRRINFRGPRLDPSPAGRRDVVIDRRTDLRYPDTPGKSSRRPAPRPAAAACGPPRTFSRGVGVSEIRPPVNHDIPSARRGGVEPRSPEVDPPASAPPRQRGSELSVDFWPGTRPSPGRRRPARCEKISLRPW